MSIRYVYYKSDGTSQTRREIIEELDQENHLTAATAIWDRLVAFYNGYLDPATPLKYKIQRIYVGSAGIHEAGAARDLYFHYDLSVESRKLMEQLLKFNTSAVVHLLPKSHFYQQLVDHMARNTVSVDSVDPTTHEPIYPILFDNGHQLRWEETPSGLGVTETAYGDDDEVRSDKKKKSKAYLGILAAAVVGVAALAFRS
jgi:hypothetical protein